MKCPFCDEEIEDGLKQCPYCKENLVKNKFIIPIITGTVLITLLGFAVYYFVNNPVKFETKEPEVDAEFIQDNSDDAQEIFFQEYPTGEFYSGRISRLVDKNGNYINNIEYGTCPGFGEYSHPGIGFSEGLACACVKKDGKDKCGFVNDKGEFIIEAKYDNAESFSGGVTVAQLNSKYGILNKNGKFIPLDCEYVDNEFINGLLYTSDGVVDKNGKVRYKTNGSIQDLYYETPDGNYMLDEKYMLDCNDNGCAYIRRKDGKRITDYKYAGKIGNGGFGSKGFYNGIAQASIQSDTNIDEHGEKRLVINFIDETGKEIIKTKCFDDGSYYFFENGFFENGLMAMEECDNNYDQRKYGYIDKKGNIVIPFEYESACPFDNNYAIVKKGDNWGYIDKKNNFVHTNTQPKYYSCKYLKVKDGDIVIKEE